MGTRTRRRRRTPTNAKLSLKSTNFVQPKSLPTNLTTLHSFQSSSSVPVTWSSLILPSGKALYLNLYSPRHFQFSLHSTRHTRKSPRIRSQPLFSLYVDKDQRNLHTFDVSFPFNHWDVTYCCCCYTLSSVAKSSHQFFPLSGNVFFDKTRLLVPPLLLPSSPPQTPNTTDCDQNRVGRG